MEVHLEMSVKWWPLCPGRDELTSSQIMDTFIPYPLGLLNYVANRQRISLNQNVRIAIKMSLKFVPKGSINNTPGVVQIMTWHRPGNMPLSEPMLVSLLTHICVTGPH